MLLHGHWLRIFLQTLSTLMINSCLLYWFISSIYLYFPFLIGSRMSFILSSNFADIYRLLAALSSQFLSNWLYSVEFLLFCWVFVCVAIRYLLIYFILPLFPLLSPFPRLSLTFGISHISLYFRFTFRFRYSALCFLSAFISSTLFL